MADTDLNIGLNAIDNASRQLAAITQQLDKLGAAQERLARTSSGLIIPQRFAQNAQNIGKAVDQMAGSIQRVTRETSQNARAIGASVDAIGGGIQRAAQQSQQSLAAIQSGFSAFSQSMATTVRASQTLDQRFQQGLQSAHDFGQQIQSAGQSLALGFTVPLVATAAVLGQFDQTASKLQAGEAFQRTAAQFKLSSDEISAALKQASGDTITSLDAAQAGSRALILGVGSSVEDFSKLMLIARDRARVFGVSTTQAFNDLTLGIGRQSRLILDNLGIIVRVEEAQKKYAATVGKSVDELSLQEQRQAFLNDVLSQTEATLDKNALATRNSSEEYQHQRAQIDELMQDFQSTVLPVLNETLGLFNSLPTVVREGALGFVAITLVLGPLLSAMGALIKLTLNIVAGIARFGAAQIAAATAAEAEATAATQAAAANTALATSEANAAVSAGALVAGLGLVVAELAAIAAIAAVAYIAIQKIKESNENLSGPTEQLGESLKIVNEEATKLGATDASKFNAQLADIQKRVAGIKTEITGIAVGDIGKNSLSDILGISSAFEKIGIQTSNVDKARDKMATFVATLREAQIPSAALIPIFQQLESALQATGLSTEDVYNILGPFIDRINQSQASEQQAMIAAQNLAGANLELANSYKEAATSIQAMFAGATAVAGAANALAGVQTQEELALQKQIIEQGIIIDNRKLQLNQYGAIKQGEDAITKALEGQSKAIQNQISANNIRIKELQAAQKAAVPKALTDEIAALEKLIPPMQREINERERIINIMQREINARQRDINELQRGINERERHVHGLEREQHSIQRQIDAIDRQAEAIERSNKPLERQISLLDIQARKIELASHPARKRLEELQKTPGVSQQVIDKAQAEVDAYDAQISELEDSQAALQIEVDLKKLQAQAIRDSTDALHDQIDAIQDNIDNIEDQNSIVQDQIGLLDDQNGKIQDEIGKLEDANGKIQDNIGKIQDDIDKRKEYIDTLVPPELQEEIDKLESENDTLQLNRDKLQLIIDKRNEVKANTGDTFDPIIHNAETARDRLQDILDRTNLLKQLGAINVQIGAGLNPQLKEILVLMSALQKGPETFQKVLAALSDPNFINHAGQAGMDIWSALNKAFGLGLALPAYAQGGLVTRPTVAMLGEAGPEYVVPANRMGMMGGVTVNIDTWYGSDQRSIEELSRQIGNQMRRRYRG